MKYRRALPLLTVAALVTGCGAGRHAATDPTAAPATSATATAAPAQPVDAIVATVDGTPIQVGEFRLTLAADKAAAYQHFQLSDGDQQGPGFWSTTVHGVRPIDWLKHRALTDAVQNKVTEQLGVRRHIAAVLDYPALLGNLSAENQQRSVAVSEHKPVYGPQQFDLAEYYDLWLSNLKMHIIDTLPKGTQAQTDKEYAALVAAAVHKAEVRIDQPVYGAIDATDLGQ
jgi:hypothetical protein